MSREPSEEQRKPAETRRTPLQRTRGGSSYQHSLSARGIKSSGEARSCANEDLLSSMERLDRATRLPLFDDDELRSGGRAYGRRYETSAASKASAGKLGQRAPRFEW